MGYTSSNKFKLIFLLILCTTIFILIYLKFYTSNITYYDNFYYLNKYLNAPNNYQDYLNNNLNFIFYIFSSFINLIIENKDVKITILLLLNSFLILSPLFILKKNSNFYYISIIYLSSPFFWYNSIHSFQPDVFAVPLVLLSLIFIEKKDITKLIIFLLLLILVKKIFLFLSIGLIAYYFFYHKLNPLKNLNTYFFMIALAIYFLKDFTYFFKIDLANIQEFITFYYTEKIVIYFIITMLIVYFHFYFCKEKKNISIIIFPLIIFYFLYPSGNLKNYYYHYYLLILPVCAYFTSKINFEGIPKVKFYSLSIVLLIILSTSPISLLFYIHPSFKYDNFMNNKNTIYENNIFHFMYDYDSSIKNIILSNDFGNIDVLDNYSITIFPNYDHFKDKHYLVRNFNSNFIFDQNCSKVKVNICSEESQNIIFDKLNSNYLLIFSKGNYNVYVSKQ